jgi:hypothetical protein
MKIALTSSEPILLSCWKCGSRTTPVDPLVWESNDDFMGLFWMCSGCGIRNDMATASTHEHIPTNYWTNEYKREK